MSDHGLTQTHCNAVQDITQQLEHLKPSPQEEQTVEKWHLGKHCGMRGSFLSGSSLLRKAATLTIYDDVSLNLCFWDPSCSSWVGVKPQYSRSTSRNIRELEDGEAILRKRLRPLHNALEKHVKKYNVPYRLEFSNPFKEQRQVTIRAPDGRHMDFRDWERAVSTDQKRNINPCSCLRSLDSVKIAYLPKQDRESGLGLGLEGTRRTRTRRVSKALREGENTNNANE
ncbi:hypothetical protein BFJ63_vAg16754 [Fusarium oxysporum f. sp. narcissi]|uniref:Uncharacterized protein n=1 Tax=Fusarium oxysporum f. sp. narcissi TaxID=451672 RepID=A0A4Q2V1D6_FUSOX|nr:hypothetical protein BFJ63_vAg16754 [Fusarium oxysporum f. sp. narcissi]